MRKYGEHKIQESGTNNVFNFKEKDISMLNNLKYEKKNGYDIRYSTDVVAIFNIRRTYGFS